MFINQLSFATGHRRYIGRQRRGWEGRGHVRYAHRKPNGGGLRCASATWGKKLYKNIGFIS